MGTISRHLGPGILINTDIQVEKVELPSYWLIGLSTYAVACEHALDGQPSVLTAMPPSEGQPSTLHSLGAPCNVVGIQVHGVRHAATCFPVVTEQSSWFTMLHNAHC